MRSAMAALAAVAVSFGAAPAGAAGHVTPPSTQAAASRAGAPTQASPAAPGGLVPVPRRLLTRLGTPGSSSIASATLRVTGRGTGLPADAAAVLLVVTGRTVAAAGALTVWPRGTQMPRTTLRVPAGATLSATTLVRVGASGALSLRSLATASSVDVVGYVPGPVATRSTGALVALPDEQLWASPAAAGSIRLPVLGRAGVPRSAVGAVLLSVAATTASGGEVRVSADRRATAGAPVLALGRGRRSAQTLTLVPVGADGAVVLTGSGRPRVSVGVVGYVTGRPGAAAVDSGIVLAAPPLGGSIVAAAGRARTLVVDRSPGTHAGTLLALSTTGAVSTSGGARAGSLTVRGGSGWATTVPVPVGAAGELVLPVVSTPAGTVTVTARGVVPGVRLRVVGHLWRTPHLGDPPAPVAGSVPSGAARISTSVPGSFPGQSGLAFNRVLDTTAASTVERGSVRLRNISYAPVTLTAAGVDSAAFAVVSPTVLPVTLPVGGQIDVVVALAPGATARSTTGLLTLGTDDPVQSRIVVPLYGLLQTGLGKEAEPPLAEIVRALGWRTSVGDARTLLGPRVGDQVSATALVALRGAEPVTVREVASFFWRDDPDAVPPSLLEAPAGRLTRPRTLVTNSSRRLQTLFPLAVGGAPAAATFAAVGRFDLGVGAPSPVDWLSRSAGQDQPKLRLFPVRDVRGEPVQGTYLLVHETGEDNDYNDEVYIVQNVSPVP